MSDTPFFSVVIPVYNKEPHIVRAINSVLNQTFQDFELIIVCDPSTDNSNAEVAKFTDPRIRVFHRDQPGPGGYAARNLGIKEARGDWIAFLDADDEWYSEHLQCSSNTIKSFSDSKFLSSARHSESDNKVDLDPFAKYQNTSTAFEMSFSDYLENASKGRRAVGTNSVVLRREFYKDEAIFPSGRANRTGDLYAWVICIAKAGGLTWSPHVASISYRDSVNMVSKNSMPSMSLNHEMVFELKSKTNYKELKLLNKYANRLIRTAYFEQKKITGKTELGLLKAFYWRNDLAFCTFWFSLSLLPMRVLYAMQNLKTGLKEKLR